MACKYCLENELQEGFRYCPKCGERIETIRGIKYIGELANIALGLWSGKLIKDEEGNILKVEREPFEVDIHAMGNMPLTKFDWEDVDISREMIWLEANSIINGGTNDENVQ